MLSFIEFFADKAPAVNHVNDIIQTFVRPVAGAILFAGSAKVISDVHPIFAMVLGVLVAGSVHAVKSVAVRPVVTATTGGAANVPVSMAEDLASTILSVISIVVPIVIILIGILLVSWLIWLMWRRANRATQV